MAALLVTMVRLWMAILDRAFFGARAAEFADVSSVDPSRPVGIGAPAHG